MKHTKRVKPEKKAIEPYSEADVRALLSALTRSKYYYRPGKRGSGHSAIHAERKGQ